MLKFRYFATWYEKQRHYFANKGPSSQSYGFSSGHVRMWELDHKEAWAQKNWSSALWCWRRLFRVPWTARRSNQSILKQISPEYSEKGRTDAEAETPVLWPPGVKSWLIGKDSDAGRDWGHEKGMVEDEMAGWHHWLDGHEFEQAPGVGIEQESLACCSP